MNDMPKLLIIGAFLITVLLALVIVSMTLQVPTHTNDGPVIDIKAETVK